MTHGVHFIDRDGWFFDSRVEKVFARIRYHEEKSNLDSHIELFLYFQNGCQSNIIISGYGGSDSSTEIFCKNGFLSYSMDKPITVRENISDTEVYGKNTEEKINVQDKKYPFALEIEDFIESIDTGKDITITSEYGQYVIAVVEAAFLSGREGRIVKLSEIL